MRCLWKDVTCLSEGGAGSPEGRGEAESWCRGYRHFLARLRFGEEFRSVISIIYHYHYHHHHIIIIIIVNRIVVFIFIIVVVVSIIIIIIISIIIMYKPACRRRRLGPCSRRSTIPARQQSPPLGSPGPAATTWTSIES